MRVHLQEPPTLGTGTFLVRGRRWPNSDLLPHDTSKDPLDITGLHLVAAGMTTPTTLQVHSGWSDNALCDPGRSLVFPVGWDI